MKLVRGAVMAALAGGWLVAATAATFAGAAHAANAAEPPLQGDAMTLKPAAAPAKATDKPVQADRCAAASGTWGPFAALPHVDRAINGDHDLMVVAIGSSSTEGIGATAAANAYPAQLESILRQRFKGVHVRVLNKGIGGETVADNLKRFAKDVLAQKPDLVIWQVGTNDAFQNKDADEIYQGILKGIGQVHAADADIALMEQQYFPERPETPSLQASLDTVRAAARAEKVVELRRYDLMKQWIAKGQFTPKTMLIGDKIHMTDASYRCLAERVADLMPAAPALVAGSPGLAPLR